MEPNIEVRKFQRSDIPTLNEMMQKIYGFSYDERLWIWKYEDNPLKKNYSYVAVANGRVIAHIGGIPIERQIRGEKLIGCQLADLISDPEHRIKGAFTLAYMANVAQCVEEGAQHFGFANANSSTYVSRSKFAAIGPMVPRFDRLVSVIPFIKRASRLPILPELVGFPIDLALGLVYSSWRRTKIERNSIEQIHHFDSRFDDLWQEVAPRFPRTNVRTSEYLNWRYVRHPVYEYKTLAFSKNGKIRGYIVLRLLTEKNIKRGLIIDLISDFESPTVWNTLLAAGIEDLTKDGAELLTCWMFEHMPYYEALRRMWFVPRPSDLSIMIYGVEGDDNVAFLNDPKNWYASMGDSDIF
ncbi:GNAT family N-acetyltransferase [Candidatus Poribacteria bacterium]|nr:GNAT family N-acetyltransferase [Candidatus Poribacteria bacterium]